MSDQKQNRLSFGHKRQFFFLLDEGVSPFVDRLDSFCTCLSSILDSIDNICNIYICLIVFDLDHVATSLRSLLSNTGYFAYRGFLPVFSCI